MKKQSLQKQIAKLQSEIIRKGMGQFKNSNREKIRKLEELIKRAKNEN